MGDDHAAHDHCGCCGRCFVWLAGAFCTPCRTLTRHLRPQLAREAPLPPWDRTYEAHTGEPCPLGVVAEDA